MAEPISLLLSHFDDGRPVLEDLDREGDQQGQPPDAESGATHLSDSSADPNDLEAQRWGLIIPQGPEGQRLKSLIQPLIDRRQEQQGGRPIQIFEVPPDLSPADAARWKKKTFESGGVFADDVPRYVTILGDLHQVSLGFQQVLCSDSFPGRLCFDAEADYERYVQKVLDWEKNPSAADKASAIYHTVHDGTAATTVGYRALIKPGMELMRQKIEEDKQTLAMLRPGARPPRDILPIEALVESGDLYNPLQDQLLNSVNTTKPSVLFTLSHGSGPPRAGWANSGDKLAKQGALSFGSNGHFSAADLGEAPFVPGGIWFMLACFGGGTPAVSPYFHWLQGLKAQGQFRGRVEGVLDALPKAGERPFVAQLPKAALASSKGPLAVMAHLDLAWTYSFQDLDTGATNRPARFMAIVRRLLERKRAGVALYELLRFLGQAESELAMEADAEAMGMPANPARRGHLWMLRQDLAGYVLLGDPAVHLPLKAPNLVPPPSISADIQTHAASLSAPPTSAVSSAAAGAAAPASALPLPLPKLEEAIAKVILGDQSTKAIAAEYQVDRDQLQDLTDRYQAAGRKALGG